jgi:hypothetical protein
VDYPRRIDGRLRAWQAEWSRFGEQTDRMVAAVQSSTLAVEALHDYSRSYRRDLNSHVDGVTVVAVARLLDHLSTVTGLEAAHADIGDIFDIIPAVRLAAGVALERGEYPAAAHATLGELYLVSGDQTAESERQEAMAHYLVAGAFPMERDILLARLHFFAGLGFRPNLVSAAIAVLGAKTG